MFRQRFAIRRADAGRRLDRFLAAALPGFSRTQLQDLIRQGAVRVGGQAVKPSHTLRRGEVVDVAAPLPERPVLVPEPIPLDILHEDEHLLVVNKPPDMVVHPARGHERGTLVAALLAHTRTLSSQHGELRAGIVHRLDRDTSGAILVAKTDAAHAALAEQFRARSVAKHYVAVVEGEPELDGDLVDAPLGPRGRSREAFAVRRDGRPAQTVYRVRRRFRGFAALDVQLLTGRTHQIRVHLAHLGHPVVADSLYGHRDALTRSELLGERPGEDEEPLIARQALHAWRIGIAHPATGERMEFTAPLPADMQTLLAALEELRAR